jgi:hypothetical protein
VLLNWFIFLTFFRCLTYRRNALFSREKPSSVPSAVGKCDLRYRCAPGRRSRYTQAVSIYAEEQLET